MPELPEVTTVCRILNREVVGKKIEDFQIYYLKLLLNSNVEEFKSRVKGQNINKIYNQAKYIIFELDEDILISHLRMEGRWGYEDPNFFSYGKKLLEAQFLLDNGYVLRYYDFRRFGTLELFSKTDFLKLSPLAKIGPQANDVNLTGKWLQQKLVKIKKPIKSTLLEQKIISGIGNIYANEILFASKINPWIPANWITLEQCDEILQNSRKILNKAIEYGGTTIHSFNPKFGTSGGYQRFLLVHGKDGWSCFNCGTEIVKEMIGGRGTYYCPKCQS